MKRHIFFAGFSLTFSAALSYYVNSSFLESVVGESRVGLVYTLAALVALILIVIAPYLGKRFGLLIPSRSLVVIFVAGLSTLIISRNPLIQVAAFVVTHASVVNLGLWLDIYLETISSNQHTGRIRGGYLTVLNTAILFAPYVSGFTLSQTGDYRLIYAWSLFVALPLVYQLFWRFAPQNLPATNLEFRKKLRDTNLQKILSLDLILNLFYFFMVIYLPLHLVHTIGFAWNEIGLIFTIMLLPFVIIEYPLGWLADTRWGEKEILNVGLVIAAISTFPIALIDTKNLLIWSLLLFATRIGASTIEAMKETYLFKKVDAGDIGIISLSRLTIPAAYLIGSILSTILLNFMPITGLFVFISVVFALGLFFSLTLEDTDNSIG